MNPRTQIGSGIVPLATTFTQIGPRDWILKRVHDYWAELRGMGQRRNGETEKRKTLLEGNLMNGEYNHEVSGRQNTLQVD